MKARLQTFYYAGSAFCVCWLALVPAQLADPDLWGRLSVAALWLARGQFPYQDVFSFTAYHHPWIDHEWLAGVLFYAALWLGGEFGLHMLKYSLILSLFYMVFSLSRRVLPRQPLAPLLLFCGLFLLFPIYGDAFYPTVRAQLFSLLGFACFVRQLEQTRLNQNPIEPLSLQPLWVLLPLGVLWANAHGGFILGLILLLLYALGDALESKNIRAARPYLLTAVGMTLAIAILNPYGLAYWPFILHALTMPRPFIPEWNPLPLFSADYWETKLLMLALGLALVLTGWRPFKTRQGQTERLTPALVLVFLIGLALKGIRFKAFLGLGALLYLPSLLQGWLQPDFPKPENQSSPPDRISRLPGVIGVSALLVLFTCYNPYFLARTVVQDGPFAQTRGLIPFPLAAVRYLQKSPYRGKLINPFTWGEFLAWELYPRFQIAWDGRYEEVYTNAEFTPLTELYALPHTHNPEHFRALLNQTGGDFLLIEVISPNQSLITKYPDWQLLYRDDFYFLYGRKSSLAQSHTDDSAETKPANRAPAAPINPRPATIGTFFGQFPQN